MEQQASSALERPFPLLMVPPPLMFGAAFGLSAALQQAVPVGLDPVPALLRHGGTILLSAGILIALTLAASFLMRRTTLNPFAEPSTFIATGPYRFSRNPMYLGLVIAYVGGILLYGSLWPLLALAAPVAALSRTVVPYEEARMRLRFGDSYDAYCASVRRWI